MYNRIISTPHTPTHRAACARPACITTRRAGEAARSRRSGLWAAAAGSRRHLAVAAEAGDAAVD